MDVFRAEVHANFLLPFLDDTREAVGAERLDALLASLGVTAAELADRTAWVSLEFCEALFAALDGLRHDPALFDRCGRMVLASPRYFVLRPLFRAFATPMLTYQFVVSAT